MLVSNEVEAVNVFAILQIHLVAYNKGKKLTAQFGTASMFIRGARQKRAHSNRK